LGRVIVCEPVERYQQTHRVPSARLPEFDYSRGVFHVVLVTKNRAPWLGRVRGGQVELAAAGRIVHDEWARTGALRAGVTLDAFVVMPDHVHGVLVLRPDDACAISNVDDGLGGGASENVGVETPRRGVSTGNATGGHINPSKRRPPNGHRPEWKPNTLGSIVGRFKYACTRRIRATHPEFAWQPRFYDVIIRDRRQLDNVRLYIQNNPAKG